MFTELTKLMDGFLETGIPFYDCIVMKDGKCVYRHSNGYTDINKKTEQSFALFRFGAPDRNRTCTP